MKRILSFFAAVSLILTSMQVQIFAAAEENPIIDFSDYTSDYTQDNKMLFNMNGILCEDGEMSFKPSSVIYGADSAKSSAWINDGTMYVYAGNASPNAMVNADTGAISIEKITKISFDVINPSPNDRMRSVAALLADGNEQAAYCFYIGGDSWWEDDNKKTTRVRTPFVRKYQNYSYRNGKIDTSILPDTPENVNTDTNNLTICGPFGKDDGKFGYEYKSAHWDVSFDTENNRVSWTVTLTPYSSAYTAYTWSDSFVDDDLPDMLANMKYPAAFGAHTNTCGYANVRIYGKIAEKPLIYDDFTASTEYNSSNKLSFTDGIKNTVISSDGHSWFTSDRHFGANASNSRSWAEDGKLYVYAGNASKTAMSVMDTGGKNFEKITRIKFDVINPDTARQRAYVPLLLDSNQEACYAFNMEGDSWWSDNNAYTTRTYTPYVRKMNNVSYSGGSINTDIIYTGDNMLTQSSGGNITNKTICGPYGPSDGKFGNNYSTAQWDVEFDTDTNTVSWTVNVIPRDSEKPAYKWSDSFVDNSLSDMIDNAKYPIALGAGTNSMSISNVRIYGTYAQTPVISDDFDGYFDSPAASFAQRLTFEKAYTAGNTPKIAENDGYSWVMSDRINSQKPESAYAFVKMNDLTENGLYVSGSSVFSPATVNLMQETRKIKRLTRVTVDAMPNNAGARPYLNLLVNKDQSSFYTFCTGVNGDGTANANREGRTEGTVNANTPFAVKYNWFSDETDTAPGNTSHNSIVLSSGVLSADPADFTKAYSAVHYDVAFDYDANTVSWTTTLSYADGTKQKWSDSFKDSRLGEMADNAVYPVALGSLLAETRFYNLKLYGEMSESYVEKDNDSINVSFDAEEYGAEEMTLVTVFYDENGGFLNAETLHGNGITTAVYPTDNVAYAEGYLFDGNEQGTLKDTFSSKRADMTIPAKKYKVACVGDSLTEGHGAKDACFKYPAVLQTLLGYEYEVKNFGVGGRAVTDYNTERNPQYISEAKYTESLEYNPDTVIIMLGANDVYEVTDSERSEVFYEEYKKLVSSYKNLSSNPQIYVMITPADNWQTDNVNLYQREPITRTAAELGAKLIDMRSLITDKKLLSDSVHLTNRGYTVLANEVYKAMMSDFNNIAYTDGSVVINPQNSVIGKMYAAGYKDGTLTGFKMFDRKIYSGNEATLDISIVTENSDEIKVFFWNGLEDMTPELTMSANFAPKVTVTGNEVSVEGRTNVSNGKAIICAYNSEGRLMYFKAADTDGDSVYRDTFACEDAYEIYVNGVKIK